MSRQDKGFVTDLCYGVLRNLRFIDLTLEPKLAKPEQLPEDIRNSLRLGAYELLLKGTPRHAAIHEWVEISKARHKKLSGLINAVLRRLEPPKSLSPAETYSIPYWLYQDWENLFASEAEAIAKAMNEPEPLWLYAYKPEAYKTLEAEGCKLSQGPTEKNLAVQAPLALHQLEAFKQGLVGPQNPSSSLIPPLLDIQPGDTVLDLASGNGIKTAQLISLGAKVIAVELSAKKVKRAEDNLARLGYSADHIVHNLETPPATEAAAKVLLDAPCSGTGTLRGHPEIKLRLTPEDVRTLARVQRKLLETAWSLTQPGGILIYAICALTTPESVQTIKQFLEMNADARVIETDVPVSAITTPYGSFILPLKGLDGFFFCKLKKST